MKSAVIMSYNVLLLCFHHSCRYNLSWSHSAHPPLPPGGGGSVNMFNVIIWMTSVAIISYHQLKFCFDYSLRLNTSWWHSSPYLTPWGVGGQKTKSTTIMLETSTVTHFLPHRTWIWLKPRSYEVWISIDPSIPRGGHYQNNNCNSGNWLLVHLWYNFGIQSQR